MKRDIGSKFGRRLREIRESKGIKQAQLASMVLKSVETISNFERGKTLPGLNTVSDLAAALAVAPVDLFAFGDPIPVVDSDPIVARAISRLALMTPAERTLLADFADLLIHHRRRPADD